MNLGVHFDPAYMASLLEWVSCLGHGFIEPNAHRRTAAVPVISAGAGVCGLVGQLAAGDIFWSAGGGHGPLTVHL